MKLIFVILAMLLGLSASKAQHSTEMHNSIWSIYQDSNDRYWFGSNGEGVYVYDGHSLTQYTTEDGLVDNAIRGIQEDKQGSVYIETPHGVSKFDGDAITTLNVVTSPVIGWTLEPDDLWFNCNAELEDVYRYDGTNLYELQLPRHDIKSAFGVDPEAGPFNPYGVYGIDKDREGNIWFGTSVAGAYRYDGESFIWFGEKELSVLDDGRVPGVRSLIQDRDGYIWLSNVLSRYKINPDNTYDKLDGIDFSKQEVQMGLPYFTSAVIDDAGNLWMVTYTEGVWKYDGAELVNYRLKNNGDDALLVSIYADNSGQLWLGTDNAGVYRWDENNFVKFAPN